MHTDEKRQVNELLAILDRIAGKGVVVVATTNYVRGLDAAVQRSGRFDIKVPLFPPHGADRVAIFTYYLSARRLYGIEGLERIDTERLAREAILLTPADIKTVVETTARRAIHGTTHDQRPALSTDDLLDTLRQHPRTIRYEHATEWAAEVAEELDPHDPRLQWFKDEIAQACSPPASSWRQPLRSLTPR